MVRLHALAVVWLAGGAALLADVPDDLVADALNPSVTCGECHQEIYQMWRRSMHSASFTDPIFQTSYLRAYQETGGQAGPICLRCHAPAAVLNEDPLIQQPLSREGITCDYCHSIVSVDLERRDEPFTVKTDGVKRGPLADADSPIHKVASSPLHESSEFCAGCHEYTNERGVSLMSTFSEWKSSPQAAQGITCQKCHMPMGPGDVVRSGFGSDREMINLHNISGGHSRDQVRKAASVRILGVRREPGSSVLVEVQVANTGSGHSIPTGMPTRKLILDVVLYAGDRQVRRFQLHYQKSVVDASGEILANDHSVLLDADSILEDTRLRAGERRLERFYATVSNKQEVLKAEASLTYFYRPELMLRQDMSIDVASDRFSP
jgi:hypothetical protein